jgi:hypothetical protein
MTIRERAVKMVRYMGLSVDQETVDRCCEALEQTEEDPEPESDWPEEIELMARAICESEPGSLSWCAADADERNSYRFWILNPPDEAMATFSWRDIIDDMRDRILPEQE